MNLLFIFFSALLDTTSIVSNILQIYKLKELFRF